MQPRVACIVITYNREDFIPICVASLLREHGDALQIEVTVINNGATDNTAEVLAAIDDPRVAIRTNALNMPIVKVLNEGLEIGHASGADYILLLNDDIEMRHGAILEMVEVCREVPNSIITPLQINYRKPDEIDGVMLDRLRTTDALLNDAILKGTLQRYYPQRALIAAALLATPETFAAVGDFDPIFSIYGWDDDYCNRAGDMGIPMLVAPHAQMLHMHGKHQSTPKKSGKEWLRRWRSQYRGRMILRLKTSDKTLLWNYFRVVGHMLVDIPKYFFNRFPGGSVIALRTLGELLVSYGKIRDQRLKETALKDAFKPG